MCHRHAFEALDRTLRDVMSQIDPEFKHIPFGNKIMDDDSGIEDLIKLPDSIAKKMTQLELIKFTFPDIFKDE